MGRKRPRKLPRAVQMVPELELISNCLELLPPIPGTTRPPVKLLRAAQLLDFPLEELAELRKEARDTGRNPLGQKCAIIRQNVIAIRDTLRNIKAGTATRAELKTQLDALAAPFRVAIRAAEPDAVFVLRLEVVKHTLDYTLRRIVAGSGSSPTRGNPT